MEEHGGSITEDHNDATPRPWSASLGQVHAQIDGRDVLIAECYDSDEGVPQFVANAQHIAHAVNCHDELLAACKALVARYAMSLETDEIARARAAIAKARAD